MKAKSEGTRRYVVCVKNRGYRASLERNKIYVVLPDPAVETEGDVRVIDETGEDYIFPSEYFVAIEVPKAVEESLRKVS